MSIQKAVQGADQQQAVVQQQAQPSQAELLKRAVQAQTKEFATVLPAGVDHERFARLVLSAVKSTPQLMECFNTATGKQSIFLAAMQCAALGIEPNTPTQEGWLLPRRVKDRSGQYNWECQLMIGYRGYLKLARNSGNVKTIFADVVREGDEFEYGREIVDDDFRDRFHHVSAGDEEASITHAYAVVRYKDGGYNFVVLGRKALDKRRDASESWKNEKARPYSPWFTSEPEMCMKSGIRSLSKWLELTPQAAQAIQSDEKAFRLSDDNEVVPVIDTQEVGERIVDVFPGEREADAETGEVIETVTTEAPVAAQPSNFDLLTAVMEEHGIEGAARLNKVGEVTGQKPKRWLPSDISDEHAKAVIDHLDTTLL